MHYFTNAVQTASEWIFPAQEHRIPVTRYNVLQLAVPPLILYVFLCYLVRRPNTQAIRLALTPIIVPWLWWLTFGLEWFPPRTMAWNVPFTTTGVLFVVRAGEYCLSPTGRLKLTERLPGEQPDHLHPARPTHLKIYHGFTDAIELILSHRGIGWDFGTGEGLRLPPMQARRPAHDRAAWLKETMLKDVIGNYLIVDAINTWWRTIPQITDPSRTPNAYRDLSLGMHLLVPVSVMMVVRCYMSMWYSFAGVLEVAFLGTAPADWPVLYGEPWKSESLHKLWAMEWHQLSRRLFLSTLGYPLRAIAGTPGMMLGAFMASGIYHNLMLIGDGQPGYDLSTNSFFLLQAVGLVVERLFRQITGRKVSGWLGNLWVFAFIVTTIQPMAKAWLERGYLETSPIPADWSLAERVVGLAQRI
ncbi:hypothetical protein FS837_012196 [Tulasnella sp. UAMH 9824]|nr:hypothetical protein FS837_012196 [Tulasnella sp. UAMH 9824]